MKKRILLLVCISILVSVLPIFGMQNQKNNVSINGKVLNLENWIINEQGTSYIPLQVVSNLFNSSLQHDKKENTYTMIKGGKTLWLQPSNQTAIINKVKTQMPARPKMIYGTLFVPLKFTFETFGATVGWDQNTNTIDISSDHIKDYPQSIKELLQKQLPEGLTQVKISATGDCILGHDIKFSTHNRFDTVLKEKNNDYSYFFKNVKSIFETDDLTIVNLEVPLTNATTRADKQFAFRGKPEFTEILKHGNVEAVNLANNHTYDYFQKGYDDTIAALKKAGISYFGLDHQSINNIKGINIGNLGYKGWNNSKWVKDGIKKDIAAMKQKTDILIVTFHWGDEGSNYPNSIQKDLGKFAIDQGADLVLGHHPHVMQGIEKYKDKYIVYSLGNFCFGGNRNPSDKDTFIFQQNFILDQNKKISSTDISIIPCTVSSVKYRNDYCPTPQKGQEGDRIMNRLNQYSKGFNATYY